MIHLPVDLHSGLRGVQQPIVALLQVKGVVEAVFGVGHAQA